MDQGAFARLSGRAQLVRLRRMGRTALATYPAALADGALTTIQHEQNATFRVDAPGGRSLLRINRPGVRTEAEITSEMAWLAALRRDTDLLVPEPVATNDGRLVVTVRDPGIPEPRSCALLRWIDGRMVDRRLTPGHLARLGETMAALQDHASAWEPPAGFVRWRLDGLTAPARRASVATPADHVPASIPDAGDARAAIALVEAHVSTADAAVVARAIAWAQEAFATLLARGAPSGLIHGDLHQENALFAGGRAAAIDFDDCGWGFHLYDLAVPLSELTERRRARELRDALLEAYGRRRPLPHDVDWLIDALIAYRCVQLVVWVIESRRDPAFRHRWRRWVRGDLDWLAGRVDRPLHGRPE